MKIQPTINNFIFLNSRTKAGKVRTELMDRMEDAGCKVFRERAVGCNSRVILGYKNDFVDFANYSARIFSDGSYEYKYSDSKHSPIPSSLKTFVYRKYTVDKNGNTDVKLRNYTRQDNKILNDYSKNTRYENC